VEVGLDDLDFATIMFGLINFFEGSSLSYYSS